MSSQVILLGQTAGTPPTGAAGGDLSRNYPNPTVVEAGGGTGTFTAGVIKVSNGTAGAPSITFTSDATTGMHDGSGQLAFAIGGIDALSLGKSTTPVGGFGNVGIGGLASISDNYPLLVARDNESSGTILALLNQTSSANAYAGIQVSSDINNGGLFASYTDASTPDPYISSTLIRPTGNTQHMVIMGGEQASGDVRVYTAGDFSATGRTAFFNADHSTTLYGGIIVNTGNAARPTAGSAYRGMITVVQGGAGVTDTLEICLKSAAGTYSWVSITTGG